MSAATAGPPAHLRLLPLFALGLVLAADAVTTAALAMAIAAAGFPPVWSALLAAAGGVGAYACWRLTARTADFAEQLGAGRGLAPSAALGVALLLNAQLLAFWLLDGWPLWTVLLALRAVASACLQIAAEGALARAAAGIGQRRNDPVALAAVAAGPLVTAAAMPALALASAAPDVLVFAAILPIFAALLLLPTRLSLAGPAPLLAEWPAPTPMAGLWRLSPFATAGCFLAGGLQASALALLPDVIARMGAGIGEGALLLALAHGAAGGAALLALLVLGHAERRLTTVLLATTTAGAAILPFGANGDGVVVFAFAALVAGIALLSRLLPDYGRELTLPTLRLPVLAGLVGATAAGAALLPVPVALAGSAFGPGGSLFGMTGMALAIALFGLFRMTRRPALPRAWRSAHGAVTPGLVASGGLDRHALPVGAQLSLALAEPYGPQIVAVVAPPAPAPSAPSLPAASAADRTIGS